MTSHIEPNAALVVIDVQTGFDDPYWGRRGNPAAEENIGRLISAWTATGRPIVRVRHESRSPGSPLAPGAPGQAFKPVVADLVPALDVVKSVHSSFHGSPDLHAWLTGAGVRQVVICGIQTNRCCETTARLAGDLGYDMLYALDATYTFDEGGLTAEQIMAVTAVNLDGHFGRVLTTDDLLSRSGELEPAL
ncbi:cysteine hydrolase family protein [Planosporangium mesophilum]|uniref:Hydrolase n=1 Tax=Planosporangium mesophilum TaxID=689768 RepID=A0A8J3WXW1_9ACTN|nr:cysteine hydrolase family protein [Planosporangium mesophilum]NJC81679.1 cysteine hydrolase [Planosporangium mesophilum]GII20660.1 hydrolase [Planosporangium mesophilum]